ncbi:MAG: dihydroxyacetone kinase subunit L [Chloroflexaceae bacterium]|nr:dihydroxyacetone kinase subunit L [Chloroflexaceae bacterium]
MHITVEHITWFLHDAAAIIKEHRDELTQLDSPIGDADHGINLDRGLSSVLNKLALAEESDDIGALLKTAGMTLISTVGGASGPLYGTAFIRAAGVLRDKQHIAQHELVDALAAALEGIKARGKAQAGEKTMIDAIEPGIGVLQEARDADDGVFLEAFRQAVAAVEEGMNATTPMLATKGRASYLGERSIGHQDPGATSAWYLAQALLHLLERIPSP